MTTNIASWANLYAVALRQSVNINSTTADGTEQTVTSAGGLTTEGALSCHVPAKTKNWGIPGADFLVANDVYGVPVTNRPVFNPGQEVNEYQKAVGSPVATAGTGYNFSKGIIAPTTTYDFDFDRRTALPWLYAMFQRGVAATATALSEPGAEETDRVAYEFVLMDATDDPTPDYFLNLYKTENFPVGELISDAIPVRMTISGSENEPLKLSFDVMGRQFSNHTFTQNGIIDAGAVALKYAEVAPYAWQDAMVCVGNINTSGVEQNHYPVEATGFEVTVTASVTGIRYNSRTPVRYIIGGYTVEGKLSIPYAATQVGGSYLSSRLVANSSESYPLVIDVFFLDATNTAPGTAITTADMDVLRDMGDTDAGSTACSHAAGDLHIGINAMVKQAPSEDGDEAMINLSFSGVDTKSGLTIVDRAIQIGLCEAEGLNYTSRPTE